MFLFREEYVQIEAQWNLRVSNKNQGLEFKGKGGTVPKEREPGREGESPSSCRVTTFFVSVVCLALEGFLPTVA